MELRELGRALDAIDAAGRDDIVAAEEVDALRYALEVAVGTLIDNFGCEVPRGDELDGTD